MRVPISEPVFHMCTCLLDVRPNRKSRRVRKEPHAHSQFVAALSTPLPVQDNPYLRTVSHLLTVLGRVSFTSALTILDEVFKTMPFLKDVDNLGLFMRCLVTPSIMQLFANCLPTTFPHGILVVY